jgi:hypothetical protein
MKDAKDGRYGHRDATMILMAFRHGLRAIEICGLEWSQVEFGRNAALHVRRAKNGKPSVHPLRGDELRALRELQRNAKTPFVFETERETGFTAGAVNRLIKTIGKRAKLPFPDTAICSATPAATPWRMPATIRERCKIGSVIARSSIPCATRSCRRRGSATSGATSTRRQTAPRRP